MSGIKCRLCQCSVDKLACYSSSLNDDGFRTMVKSVFPFPLSKDYSVASKTYNMPVLICFQCSTVVRNFYNFSKQVEAIQTKLKKQCLSRDGSLPINQLVQYIKEEPGFHEDAGVEGTNESLLMSADIEVPECETETSSTFNRTSEQHHKKPFELHSDTKGKNVISYDAISCVDKTEVVSSIESVEQRVAMLSEKLDVALRANLKKAKQNLPVSVDFDLVNNEQEFKAFDNKLENTEYMRKIVDWLNHISTETSSAKRMKQAAERLFCRAFLAKCTWTGNGIRDRTIAIKKYTNVIKLFRTVGSTSVEFVTEKMVAKFWQNKTKSIFFKLR